MITFGKASVAGLAVCACLAAATHADEKDRQSGRRNGTVHGPGTFGEPSARFALLQSFGSPCSGEIDPGCEGKGVDHIAAGAGLRRAGTGTIRLRGAPPGAVLEAAFLYVGLIEALDPGSPSSLPDLTVNGVPVRVERIARYGQHCWELAPSALLPGEATLYRGKVDPIILPDINGEYVVSGVPSAISHGDDPFRCAAPGCDPQLPLAQGASLVAIWRHPTVPAKSRVTIHEAEGVLPQLTDLLVVHHALWPPGPAAWTSLRFTSAGGDGQTRDPDISFEPVAPIATHLGLGGPITQIRGPLSLIEPNADWTGMDGGSIPQLWDTRSTDAHRGELGFGGLAPISYEILYEALGGPAYDYDCVNPSVHVLSLYADP